jgi:hypothetical protein
MLLNFIAKAVYVDAKEEKAIVAIQPKATFREDAGSGAWRHGLSPTPWWVPCNAMVGPLSGE